MDTPATPVTILLSRWRGGDEAALQELTALLYSNLHQIAERLMLRERADHTLQPTALVNEAYMRLIGAEIAWQDRVHFLAIAAREMRRILVEHARAKGRQKRGGNDWQRVTLTADGPGHAQELADVLAVHEALERLAALDARKEKIIELIIFGGLTTLEAAEVLGISEATLHRDWRMAKAWLQHELKPRST
jgi:RNA polymerase sigma factor (TIGR02999 family)